jgi:hypothetical protein
MEHFVISRFLTARRALRLLLKRVIKSILFSHSLATHFLPSHSLPLMAACNNIYLLSVNRDIKKS